MTNIEQDIESEQFLRLINPFISAKLGNTFGAMTPDQSLVTNGYSLADPARTKILYFLVGKNDRYTTGNGGAVTVKLSTLSGSFSALWFDPRTGNETVLGSLIGGRDHVLTPPNTDDWVLLLTRSGTLDTVPPSPPLALRVILAKSYP
jgi:hypothetical protein